MALLRRLAASGSRPLHRMFSPIASPSAFGSAIPTRNYSSPTEVADPEMNGGYINPPRVKRQLRDPYGDWWDKQDRRSFGEPVHEDHDILGVFSPEPYNHFPPKKVLLLNGCFIAFILSLAGTAYLTYPDKVTVPRTFPGGLDRELGFTVPALEEKEDS